MGFLRKIGKKVKRGMNKLFGSKFGKIIGGIGLAMMFWGGANAMFGNTKWFQGMKTNIGKLNPFAKGDVTGAVSEVTLQPTGFEKTLADAGAGVAGKSSTVALEPNKFEKFLSGDLSKVEALDTAKFSNLNSIDKVAKLGVEAGKGAYTVGEAAGSFLKPSGDIIPDVTKGTLTGLTLNALQGEQEMNTGGFGQVAQRAPDAAPVDAYMSKINTDMPNLQATNFQQLSQNLMFGTLSPQFITQFG